MFGMRLVKHLAAVVAVAVLVLAAGCGGKTSQVSGTVKTSDGKAVNGGQIVFVPAGEGKTPGASIQCKVGKDGSYSAKNVTAGEAKVMYNPPPDEWPAGVEPKASTPPPASPWKGYKVKSPTATITGGSMALDIVVVPGDTK
jgi:hypothetical protein